MPCRALRGRGENHRAHGHIPATVAAARKPQRSPPSAHAILKPVSVIADSLPGPVTPLLGTCKHAHLYLCAIPGPPILWSEIRCFSTSWLLLCRRHVQRCAKSRNSGALRRFVRAVSKAADAGNVLALSRSGPSPGPAPPAPRSACEGAMDGVVPARRGAIRAGPARPSYRVDGGSVPA
jgi:hypothetical protein